MTNLYNFMDGSDGLAGGMAAIGFGALALAAWLGGAPGLAAFCAAIAAAALAFLRFNFPPARIFMGDGGALLLGSLLTLAGGVILTLRPEHRSIDKPLKSAFRSAHFVSASPKIDTITGEKNAKRTPMCLL